MKKNVFRAFAVIFSAFSVLFSLSIVNELKKTNEGFILIMLAIFVATFVVFIEVLKVKELNNWYNARRTNWFLIVFTFIISFGSSCLGIYFWTNKTQELSNEIAEGRQNEIALISNEYSHRIDSIQKLSVVTTAEYIQYNKELSFLKARVGVDSLDTRNIRTGIMNLQSNVNSLSDKFSKIQQANIDRLNADKLTLINSVDVKYNTTTSTKDRNNLVSLIFMIMAVVTELVIVILQREIAESKKGEFSNNPQFIRETAILKGLYMASRENTVIGINDIKYSNFAKGMEWDDIKKFYNLLKYLCVLKNDYLQANGIDILTVYYKDMQKIFN